jgi:hypothetical protein
VPLYLADVRNILHTFVRMNIHAGSVDSVFAGDGLPKSSTDLIALCGY